MNSAVVALALLTPAAEPEPAPDVSNSVRVGLKWLAGQQREDGSWIGANNVAPTTITATAGLALLMEGSTPRTGTYAPNIRKVIGWLDKKAGTNGMLASNSETEMYQYVPSHANALLFLVCAYDVDDDPERTKRVAEMIEKAVAFAVACQTSRGGWGFISARDGSDYDDGQSTTTVLQALFAVRRAGFDVPRTATDKAVQYLVRSTAPNGGIVYTLYGNPQLNNANVLPLNTASAAAGLLMTEGTRPEALARWVRHASAFAGTQMRGLRNGGSPGMQLQYQMARAACSLGETGHTRLDPDARDADLVKWSAIRAPLFKAVRDAQGKDGSWPDLYLSPAYTTALALVILQLDNGYLPAFSR